MRGAKENVFDSPNQRKFFRSLSSGANSAPPSRHPSSCRRRLKNARSRLAGFDVIWFAPRLCYACCCYIYKCLCVFLLPLGRRRGWHSLSSKCVPLSSCECGGWLRVWDATYALLVLAASAAPTPAARPARRKNSWALRVLLLFRLSTSLNRPLAGLFIQNPVTVLGCVETQRKKQNKTNTPLARTCWIRRPKHNQEYSKQVDGGSGDILQSTQFRRAKQ